MMMRIQLTFSYRFIPSGRIPKLPKSGTLRSKSLSPHRSLVLLLHPLRLNNRSYPI